MESLTGAAPSGAAPGSGAVDSTEAIRFAGSVLELLAHAAAIRWCAYLLPDPAGHWGVAAAAGDGAPALGAAFPGAEVEAALSSATAGESAAPPGTLVCQRVHLPGDLSAAVCAVPCAGDSDAGAHEVSESLLVLANHLAALLASWDAAQRASTQDPVASVLTQVAVEDRLAEEVARAQRYGGGLSVLLCDLEQLRPFRDAAGHRAGDTVLRAAGTALRAHLRQTDVVGRHSGDTFLVVLPETRADEALRAGGRLAQAVTQAITALDLPALARRPDTGEPWALRLRIGASTYPSPARAAEELVDQAEGALRAARESGDAEWLRHWLDSINQALSTGYSCVCRHCGRTFEVEDRAQQRARRFCSHACYVQARRAEESKRNERIRALRQRGLSAREIARRFGLSAERVRQICLRVV